VAAGTRLAIVRHGEAHCNVEEVVGGHRGCRGLTERGVRQAEALARRLRRTGEFATASALYTSVLPRAVMTAEILSDALGLGTPVRTCSLCERHPGEADGLTWAQFEARYRRRSLPGDDPELPLSPGGESWAGFLDRAADALRRIAAAHPGELVVVAAHGGVIDASLIRFLSLPDHGAAVRLHPEHTSITEWHHTGGRWRLVRYADAAHLLEGEGLRASTPEWVQLEAAPAAPAQQV